MRVLLIDYDGKIPNLALMKLSTYYRSQGHEVYLNEGPRADKVLVSVLFTWHREEALKLQRIYPNIEFGGTGFDVHKKLPAEVERSKPDYSLYTIESLYNRMRGVKTREKRLQKAQELVSAGLGYTSRGCVRKCGFCLVPKAEGCFRQVASINDLLNPASNVLILLDNNFAADPLALDKLLEIKDRNLVVDLTQGLDVRFMTPELAKALSGVKHLRSIHYAWDLMEAEQEVLQGIQILSEFIKPWRHMCYTLVGYNTTMEENLYRVHKLIGLGVDPYCMVYNDRHDDPVLRHFARWVNARVYKVCPWEQYAPYTKYLQQQRQGKQTTLSVA